MKFMLTFALMFIGAKAVSFNDLVQEQWTEFKLDHAKKYKTPMEERYRMKIFMENAHKVAKHNQLYEKGLVTFSMKLNKYSDMLSSEIVQTMNGYNRTTAKTNSNEDVEELKGATYIPPANVKLADEVDWRASGAVTKVKDQEQCASCWSFSATGSLEGQHFRKTGKLVSLSEQNLIDCSTNYGNYGCKGGLANKAFQYIRDNRGIDTEWFYPYEARNNNCRYNPANSGATDTGYMNIPWGNEIYLQWAVATVGPISVGIDASHDSFHHYGGGVYYEPACSMTFLDHAVLVVGYGTENGQDYWLVKNSWGTSWGDQGYIKMARNRNNNCGIVSQASYPLV